MTRTLQNPKGELAESGWSRVDNHAIVSYFCAENPQGTRCLSQRLCKLYLVLRWICMRSVGWDQAGGAWLCCNLRPVALEVWGTWVQSQSVGLMRSTSIYLEGLMLKLKVQYFDHLMRRVDSLEKTDAGKDWGQEEKGVSRRWVG